jgi:hypothetical protein
VLPGRARRCRRTGQRRAGPRSCRGGLRASRRGFANTIGGWPVALSRRRLDLPATPLACDDPHLSDLRIPRARAHRLRRHRRARGLRGPSGP